MTLRALVVDDETLARAQLRRLLSAWSDVDVIGECASGDAAVAAIERLRPDVVLLDVQMPHGDGFSVINVVGPARMPLTIFVTAYDEYAIRAFELRAVDYLLKPVAPERLRETLDRLRRRLHSDAPPSAEPQIARLERLPVEAAGKTVLIDLSDIRFAEARGDVVYVKTAKQVYPTRFSLQELERRLPNPPFLRIHRAFLVNLKNVVEIRPYFNGAYLLKTSDAQNTELTVSRGHVKSLRSLLGL